jgi:hypothetical protein
MAYSYSRRNEIARAKGFDSYRDYRRTVEFANKSKDFGMHVGKAGGRTGENLDMARLYYAAFKESDPKDYGIQTSKGRPIVRRGKDGKPKGAKAKWLIDVAGYVGDADEWRRRYPNGVRSKE